MMRIINTVEVPPGGWRYYVAETDTWLDTQDLKSLVSTVLAHYVANDIYCPPDLSDRIENQICRRLPPERCRIRLPEGLDLTGRLSLGQIIAGTNTILKWILSGVERVDQEEADRRARICASCDANRDTRDCSACGNNQVRELVEKAFGSKATAYHDKLFYCLSCGCALKASVWCPLEIQQKNMPKEINDRLPDDCWKKVRHE